MQKQALGKKKMQAIGKVNVPSEAILAVPWAFPSRFHEPTAKVEF